MRSTAILAMAALALSCGEPAMRVSFTAHALGEGDCRVEGLQAKLEVSGVEDPCYLYVTEEHTVDGFCPAVPAGAEREFRLVYFLAIEGDPVPLDLAMARQKVDLSDWSDAALTLEFPADTLEYELFDDDNDQVSNLEEMCDGRHPREPG